MLINQPVLHSFPFLSFSSLHRSHVATFSFTFSCEHVNCSVLFCFVWKKIWQLTNKQKLPPKGDDKVRQLTEMGFSEEQSKFALDACVCKFCFCVFVFCFWHSQTMIVFFFHLKTNILNFAFFAFAFAFVFCRTTRLKELLNCCFRAADQET